MSIDTTKGSCVLSSYAKMLLLVFLYMVLVSSKQLPILVKRNP
jgi:hypothetical protein